MIQRQQERQIAAIGHAGDDRLATCRIPRFHRADDIEQPAFAFACQRRLFDGGTLAIPLREPRLSLRTRVRAFRQHHPRRHPQTGEGIDQHLRSGAGIVQGDDQRQGIFRSGAAGFEHQIP